MGSRMSYFYVACPRSARSFLAEICIISWLRNWHRVFAAQATASWPSSLLHLVPLVVLHTFPSRLKNHCSSCAMSSIGSKIPSGCLLRLLCSCFSISWWSKTQWQHTATQKNTKIIKFSRGQCTLDRFALLTLLRPMECCT